ncbi:MAG: heme transporter HemC [Actinobacteria bacterium]|nr:heme transporter HemC [Actinomycetota bacterium]
MSKRKIFKRDQGATSSPKSRLLGLATLLGLVTLFVFAFFLTDPDVRLHPTTGEEIGQFDAVRLLYLHVPMAIIGPYVAPLVGAIASLGYLIKRTQWWDVTAHAAIEVGAIFCGLVLLTGSIWGRPVWNTWWEWGDVRLMTTLILFLMLLGYLALRRVAPDGQKQARRSAIVAIVAAINLPIINRSVEWWESRTLHQKSTLSELKIEDLTFFTLMMGIVVFLMLFTWLVLHRFRLGWLEKESLEQDVLTSIEERRSEATVNEEGTL